MRSHVKKPRQKYIRCLERRASYLAEKISTSKQNLTFDKAEVSALKWAVLTLKALYPNEYNNIKDEKLSEPVKVTDKEE